MDADDVGVGTKQLLCLSFPKLRELLGLLLHPSLPPPPLPCLLPLVGHSLLTCRSCLPQLQELLGLSLPSSPPAPPPHTHTHCSPCPLQLQELLGLSLDEAEAVELDMFRSSGDMPDRSFTI